MVYAAVAILSLGQFFDLFGALACALGLIAALAFLGGSDSDSDGESSEIRERLGAVTRAYSVLVQAISDKLDAAARASEKPPKSGLLFDVDEFIPEAPKKTESDSQGKGSSDAGSGLNRGAKVNHVDFWREDYWNFENSVEDDLFASDEPEDRPDSWKDNGEEDAKDGPDDALWNDREQKEDEAEAERDSEQKRANYFGSFFKNRNYPTVDDPDSDGARDDGSDAPKRWRRKENPDGQKDPDGQSGENQNDAPEWKKRPDRGLFEEFDRLFKDKSEDAESPSDGGDSDESTAFGLDYDLLEDENVSLDGKLDYLRERVKAGNEEARGELARLLLQRAALAKKDEEKEAMAALDEIESVVFAKNDDYVERDQYDELELLVQANLQRVFFYLRNGMAPPLDMANGALQFARDFAGSFSQEETARLLATAYQAHGLSLLASGAEAAALRSFNKARAKFSDLVDGGVHEAEPSIGFVSVAMGDAYMAIGDANKAVEEFRFALETFDSFSGREGFLAENVNVSFRLSRAYRSLGDLEKADAALEMAIQSEERLLSFDETSYINPLVELLEEQADKFFTRGKHEEAVASLDRAVSSLERFLTYDVVMPRRVLAYAHLANALQRRATIHFLRNKRLLAVIDLERAVESLTSAVKKGETFDPFAQALILVNSIYDMCASYSLWDDAVKARKESKRLYEGLPPDKKSRINDLYARMLVYRGGAMLRRKNRAEARIAAEEAVSILEPLCEGKDAEPEKCAMLARAYGICARLESKKRAGRENSMRLFRRAKELELFVLSGPDLDDQYKNAFVDDFTTKAKREAKDGELSVALDDVRTAVRIAVSELNAGRWAFLAEFVEAVGAAVKIAVALRGPKEGLRILRAALRYAERVRKSYVDKDWAPDEGDDISPRNIAFMRNIELLTVDLRFTRFKLLSSTDWQPEFARYCDMRFYTPPEDSEEKDGPAFPRQKLDPVTSYIIDMCDENNRGSVLRRRALLLSKALADSPAQLARFVDLEACRRVFMRHALDGEFEFFGSVLDILRTTLNSISKRSDLFLADPEMREAERVFDGPRVRVRNGEFDEAKTRLYWSNALVFRRMQANHLLGVWEGIKAADAASPPPDGIAKKLRETFIDVLRAKIELVFQLALEAGERAPSELLTAPQTAPLAAAFFQWLLSNGQKDRAFEFARLEEKRLLREDAVLPPIQFMCRSAFYEAIAEAAQGAGELQFAEETLRKCEALFSSEDAVFDVSSLFAESRGNVYAKLAELAYERGDLENASSYFTKAGDVYAEELRSRGLSRQGFERYVELLSRALSGGSREEARRVARRYREMCRLSKTWNADFRAEVANAFWALTVVVLMSSEKIRASFYHSKQALKQFDRILKWYRPNSPEIKVRRLERGFSAFLFWMRHGAYERASTILNALFPVFKKNYESVVNDPKESADPQERELTFWHVASPFVVVGMFWVQLRLVGLGRFSSPEEETQFGKTVEELLAAAKRTPLISEGRVVTGAQEETAADSEETAAGTEPSPDAKPEDAPLKSRAQALLSLTVARAKGTWGALRRKIKREDPTPAMTDSNALKFALSYCMTRLFYALWLAQKGEYELAVKERDAAIRETRKWFGAGSMEETACFYYWAVSALRRRRFSEAIRWARTVVASFPKEARDVKEPVLDSIPFVADAYRICAFARVERRAPFDLVRARRDVERGIEFCRTAFANRLFTPRSVYAELIFARAKVERARGRLHEALVDATRVKAMLDKASRRGVATPSVGVKDELNEFLISLTEEIADRRKREGESLTEPQDARQSGDVGNGGRPQ